MKTTSLLFFLMPLDKQPPVEKNACMYFTLPRENFQILNKIPCECTKSMEKEDPVPYLLNK